MTYFYYAIVDAQDRVFFQMSNAPSSDPLAVEVTEEQYNASRSHNQHTETWVMQDGKPVLVPRDNAPNAGG